jgi:hypothetical protein
MSKQSLVNDALGVLVEVKDNLSVVNEFVSNIDDSDKDLMQAAKQAVDAVDLLRLKMFNRSTQGKYRK